MSASESSSAGLAMPVMALPERLAEGSAAVAYNPAMAQAVKKGLDCSPATPAPAQSIIRSLFRAAARVRLCPAGGRADGHPLPLGGAVRGDLIPQGREHRLGGAVADDDPGRGFLTESGDGGLVVVILRPSAGTAATVRLVTPFSKRIPGPRQGGCRPLSEGILHPSHGGDFIGRPSLFWAAGPMRPTGRAFSLPW